MSLNISQFDYSLPQSAIAMHPPAQRGDSRLLCVGRTDGRLRDAQFPDLVEALAPGDLLVLNNTRVIPARLFASKATGGRVEIFLERLLDAQTCLAQIGASKPTRAGARLTTDGGAVLEVVARHGKFHRLALVAPHPDPDPASAAAADPTMVNPTTADLLHSDLASVFEQEGHMPLPPYIDRADDPADRSRYQTVFAREQGAVAAPTAGLHFDEPLLAAIAARGVEIAHITLHVGAGTFLPVRTEDLTAHEMHGERVLVDATVCRAIAETRARGGRVVAVGTTVMRALESAALAAAGIAAPAFDWAAAGGHDTDPDLRGDTVPRPIAPFSGETELFVRPGFTFGVVDALVTNFHQPRSTLLVLVSAFAGRRNILAAYAHALANGYRFLSYGDAMLIR